MLYRYIKVALVRRISVVDASRIVPSNRKRKLAVVGCGPSINDLDSDYFNRLSRDYDVVTLSYSAMLPVDMCFYLYEIPRGDLQDHHNKYLYPTLLKKGKEGRLGQILLKNPHAKESVFFKHFPTVQCSMTFPIHLQDKGKLFTFLKIVDFLGLAKKYFIQCRASVFSTCFWASKVGYEEILLIGIDLNTSKYFYESENPWIDFNIPNPFPNDILAKDIHPTNDEDKGMTLVEAMSVLSKHVDTKIFVSHAKSALSSVFETKVI